MEFVFQKYALDRCIKCRRLASCRGGEERVPTEQAILLCAICAYYKEREEVSNGLSGMD